MSKSPRLLSGRRGSPLVVEGLREWQRRGAPDVVLLEIAERRARIRATAR